MPSEPYYLQNFERLRAHALTVYPDLLDAQERQRIDAFAMLPPAARMLYVRMLTRRGPVLRSDRLNYPEIGPSMEAAAVLIDAGLIDCNPPIHAQQLLGLMTETELTPLARALGQTARANKPERVAGIAARLPTALLYAWIGQHFHWLRLCAAPWLDSLMLLYFGNRRQDLSTFVVAELGHVRYESIECAGLRAFVDRADFERFRALLDLRAEGHHAVAAADGLALLGVAHRLALADEHRLLPGRRARALVAVAEALERLGMLEAASATCAHADTPEAARRQSLLSARIARRSAPDAAPKRQRTPLFRPPEETLSLHWQPGLVEAQTLAALGQQGYRGAHFENLFAGTLFGLLCWDLVFAALPGAFFNAYQNGPADLEDSAFYTRRRSGFDSRIAAIEHGVLDWRSELERVHADKRGIANPFVNWHELGRPSRSWNCFVDLCAGLTNAAAAMICRRMASDPRRHRIGFPDLSLRCGGGPTVFCEVKSPNDQLQQTQRQWLAALQASGHRAWVARIVVPSAGAP